MTPEQFQKVKILLANALERPPDSREAYLVEQCPNDQELLSEIMALLTYETDQEFLNNSALNFETEDTTIPQQIGRIKIDRLIASGGMGKVYAGVDELLKRKVAIKVMHSEYDASAEHRSTFLNEAQVLSNLQHPNICQIHDFFIEDDKDILVLEFIDGFTLRDALKNKQISKPLNVAKEIITALTTAHEQGIIHRDLKPDNIMITQEGNTKILDFGLARMRPVTDDSQRVEAKNMIDDKAAAERTQISGTPGYMSPEQAQGVRASTATDLWSFGLILCELLSGEKPYPKESTTQELLKRARLGDYDVPESLSRDQKKLINRLLDPNSTMRPSARMTLDSIDKIIDKPKRRLKMMLALFLTTLALLSVWKYTYDLNHERNMAIDARKKAEALVDYMLNDLYTGLRSVGRTDLLESAANQALQYYGNLSDEQMQLTKGKPATALLQIAEVFADRGNKSRAIETLETAIEKLIKLQHEHPEDELIMYRLADAYIAAADILRVSGQLELTKKYAKLATTIGQQLTTGLSPGQGPDLAPDGTGRWRILLRSMYLNADGHMRSGERKQAIQLLEEVVVIAIPAVKNNSLLMINLSDIQFKRCGTYYDANILNKVLEPCLSNFEIDRQLYEASPEDYQMLKNYIGDHAQTANVYRKLGYLNKGLKIAQSGIELGEELIKWDPNNNNTLNEFVVVLLSLGRIQLELKLIPESQATFNRALEIIEPIAADQEEISYMNSHFISLIFLGQIDAAKQVANVLQSHGFMRRDYQELCLEFNIEECQISDINGVIP